jgi:hypothetical protein
VDGVEGEQDRNMQPGLLHRDVLEVVDLHGISKAEDSADPLLRVRVGYLPVGQQLHLLELLLEGHFREKGVHLCLDRRPTRGARRVTRGETTNQQAGGECEYSDRGVPSVDDPVSA